MIRSYLKLLVLAFNTTDICTDCTTEFTHVHQHLHVRTELYDMSPVDRFAKRRKYHLDRSTSQLRCRNACVCTHFEREAARIKLRNWYII